jgi:hypothetical protein
MEEKQKKPLWQSRLLREYKELKERVFNLKKFLDKEEILDIVGESQHDYLKIQLKIMDLYKRILEERMKDLKFRL